MIPTWIPVNGIQNTWMCSRAQLCCLVFRIPPLLDKPSHHHYSILHTNGAASRSGDKVFPILNNEVLPLDSTPAINLFGSITEDLSFSLLERVVFQIPRPLRLPLLDSTRYAFLVSRPAQICAQEDTKMQNGRFLATFGHVAISY